MSKCYVCKEEGIISQGPWPLPITECYCNKCFALESLAYTVWRKLFPEISKFNAPIPIIRSMADIPSECIDVTFEEMKAKVIRENVEAFYRELLTKKMNDRGYYGCH